MELFELKDYTVVFSPQALLLKPFKILWTRDKNKLKTRALAELAFVFYYSDFKSDFSDILDEELKIQEIVRNLNVSDDWKPDDKVMDACQFYIERSETVSSRLLKNIIQGVNNIGEMFKDIDVNAIDDKGKPVYNIAQLVTAAKSIPALITALKEAEIEVKKQSSIKDSNLRGTTRSKSMFEDGI